MKHGEPKDTSLWVSFSWQQLEERDKHKMDNRDKGITCQSWSQLKGANYIISCLCGWKDEGAHQPALKNVSSPLNSQHLLLSFKPLAGHPNLLAPSPNFSEWWVELWAG